MIEQTECTSKIDIAYIVSHGFAARMVIQTNLLGLLRVQGLKVALIAPDGQDENLVSYCSSNDIALFEFQADSKFWTDQYFVARKYFLENIHANPALLEKHVRATKLNRSLKPWRRLRPYLWYGFHWFANRSPSLRNWYKKREARHLESAKAKQLIEQISPQLVVATYPVSFSEAMLLRSAKQLGRKTIIHLLSWDNITAKGHFPQLADEYIAWGPIMQQELKSYYGIKDQHIHVCGVPHFDLHVQHRQSPQVADHLVALGLNPDLPYLFFGMSSPRFAPKEIDIVESLATSLVKNTFGSDMQLIIRPHPQNVQGGMADKSWLPRLEALKSNRVSIDFPDLAKSKMPWSMQQKDMGRMSNLLAGAKLSYNSGSTLSIDALMVNTPVILTSFDGAAQLTYWESARRLIDYVHLKKLVDCGGICVAKSYQQLEEYSLSFLNNSDYLMAKRQYTARQECANYDMGEATLSCVKVLEQLVPKVTQLRHPKHSKNVNG